MTRTKRNYLALATGITSAALAASLAGPASPAAAAPTGTCAAQYGSALVGTAAYAPGSSTITLSGVTTTRRLGTDTTTYVLVSGLTPTPRGPRPFFRRFSGVGAARNYATMKSVGQPKVTFTFSKKGAPDRSCTVIAAKQ